MLLDEVLSTRLRVRTMRVLCSHPDHWYSVGELAEDAGVHRVLASRALGELEALGAVACERKGRVRLCRANTANRFVRTLLLPLFAGEREAVDGAVGEFLRALRPEGHPSIRSVILYGSAAAPGAFTLGSDIDVLVVVSSEDEAVERAAMDACSSALASGVVVMADVVTAGHLRELRARDEAFYRSLRESHRCVYGATLLEVSP